MGLFLYGGAGNTVDHSDWVDLTATITTKVAAGLTADPGSIAGGLTVATTTGTFDGASVACNSFAWTTTAAARDGTSEASYVSLGTVASLLTGYDPASYGIQLVADLVATGTLNSTQPIIHLGLNAGGGAVSTLNGVGWLIVSASSATAEYLLSSSSDNAYQTGIDPTSVAARSHMRLFPLAGAGVKPLIFWSHPAGLPDSIRVSQSSFTYDTSDDLYLCLGQSTTTAAALSGIKVRFRARIFDLTNIDLGALDFGCAT